MARPHIEDVCSCRHAATAHTVAGEACDGNDSWGFPCECWGFELDRVYSGRHEDDGQDWDHTTCRHGYHADDGPACPYCAASTIGPPDASTSPDGAA